jgi:hypothetical protein
VQRSEISASNPCISNAQRQLVSAPAETLHFARNWVKKLPSVRRCSACSETHQSAKRVFNPRLPPEKFQGNCQLSQPESSGRGLFWGKVSTPRCKFGALIRSTFCFCVSARALLSTLKCVCVCAAGAERRSLA